MENVITRVEQQKNNPQRVNIFINDEFAFPLSRVNAAWLKPGQTLSEQKIKDLIDADNKEKALSLALRFLSFKPRTRYEVEQKLIKSGVLKTDILYVIDRLMETELINDMRFAQDWVEIRSQSKPRSRRIVKMELKAKRIPEDVIEDVLQTIQPDVQSAEKAAVTYSKRLSGVQFDVFRKRMNGFLLRRGFSWDVISQVTQDVWKKVNQTRRD